MSMRICKPCAWIVLVITSYGMSQSVAEESVTTSPDNHSVRIRIWPETVIRHVSPTFIGINLHPGTPRPSLIADSTIQQRVRGMGMKTIRFPNGCEADRYNWKNPPSGSVTVDQFLDFCDAIDAEAYYTLNMQGGTEGLEVPASQPASVDLLVRCKHKAPNPCGYTDYHFGTLQEAIELVNQYTIRRALDGKRPLTSFELGNENWGQAKSDWPPEVYGKTCEVYTTTLRHVVQEAVKANPKLAGLRLYFTAVGFPTMGNNQDPLKDMDRAINVTWTRQINRLADIKLIDAVQEHFYPGGYADGGTLVWTHHNLHNILCLRNGVPNDRLKGYLDPELAYRVPIEWTEWNLKCWGNGPAEDLKLENRDFEAGTKGWTVEANPAASANATSSADAKRQGERGILLKTSAGASYVELKQTFSIAEHKPAAGIWAGVWVRTETPSRLHVILRQANDGAGKGSVLADRTAAQTQSWERVLVAMVPKPDTTSVELVLRLEGENSSAWIDEARLYRWPTFAGAMPLAADRYEQQLFMVDALRELLLWPTPRTHYHHLFGDYPCPCLNSKGADRPNAAAFRLLDRRIGRVVVKSECDTPTLPYDTLADTIATDFNAIAPDVNGVPMLSTVTTRDDRHLYMLMINRSTDQTLRANIAVEGVDCTGPGDVRILSGRDFDVPGAELRNEALTITKPFVYQIPPREAHVLTLPYKADASAR